MKYGNITYIKAKIDLFNNGLCFTKGNIYEVNKRITTTASLMEVTAINDMGEVHNIGSWWRDFEIVENEQDETEY